MTPSILRLNSSSRAFESLYRRHVNDVYRYSLAMLDRAADAEDATQTTFLNAYRALERGERPRDSGRWLRAIALNVCREHYRRASRRPDEVSLNDDPGELVRDPPTPAIGDVIRGLSCLPFNQRAALVMREFEGRSLAEIATALHVSDSAVEALLFRARRALREHLEGTLSCAQAERAISRQLDGALPRAERGPLRAHLRQCSDCASLARRLRGQRSALRGLALIPIPASLKLSKLLTGGAAGASAPVGASAGGSLLFSLGGSVAAKLAVGGALGVAALGVGYTSVHGRTPAAGRPSRVVSPAVATTVTAGTHQTRTSHRPSASGSANFAARGAVRGTPRSGRSTPARPHTTASRTASHAVVAKVSPAVSTPATAQSVHAKGRGNQAGRAQHGHSNGGGPPQSHRPSTTPAASHQHPPSRGLGRAQRNTVKASAGAGNGAGSGARAGGPSQAQAKKPSVVTGPPPSKTASPAHANQPPSSGPPSAPSGAGAVSRDSSANSNGKGKGNAHVPP